MVWLADHNGHNVEVSPALVCQVGREVTVEEGQFFGRELSSWAGGANQFQPQVQQSPLSPWPHTVLAVILSYGHFPLS